jgi:hypothetical protein
MTPPPADWVALFRILDAYGTAGRMAELWWRDDDATAPTPALTRLREISAATGIRPLIAVIPARATPELAALTDLVVCQHGWNHDNHAPLGQSKAELGAHRPLSVVMGELARGWLKIKSLFPAPLPVLVPPHNRISKEAADLLAAAGYRGLSTFNARKAARPGLIQANTHCDIMDWHTRAFGGEGPALGALVAHLAAKLDGKADPDEPTGLLTHHLAHDEAAWDFTDAVLRRVAAHPAVIWRDPAEIFGAAA